MAYVLSEVSASGWSVVQRNATECGREASVLRCWSTIGCCAMGGERNISLTGLYNGQALFFL